MNPTNTSEVFEKSSKSVHAQLNLTFSLCVWAVQLESLGHVFSKRETLRCPCTRNTGLKLHYVPLKKRSVYIIFFFLWRDVENLHRAVIEWLRWWMNVNCSTALNRDSNYDHHTRSMNFYTTRYFLNYIFWKNRPCYWINWLWFFFPFLMWTSLPVWKRTGRISLLYRKLSDSLCICLYILYLKTWVSFSH